PRIGETVLLACAISTRIARLGWGLLDSNQRPDGSEPPALTPELRPPGRAFRVERSPTDFASPVLRVATISGSLLASDFVHRLLGFLERAALRPSHGLVDVGEVVALDALGHERPGIVRSLAAVGLEQPHRERRRLAKDDVQRDAVLIGAGEPDLHVGEGHLLARGAVQFHELIPGEELL